MLSAINYSAYCNTTSDPIKNFFLLTNDEIFYVMDYSPFLAMWGKAQNVYSTFIWNYMDVFVMIVSIGLAAKFRQLNDNLRKFKGLVSGQLLLIKKKKNWVCGSEGLGEGPGRGTVAGITNRKGTWCIGLSHQNDYNDCHRLFTR